MYYWTTLAKNEFKPYNPYKQVIAVHVNVTPNLFHSLFKKQQTHSCIFFFQASTKLHTSSYRDFFADYKRHQKGWTIIDHANIMTCHALDNIKKEVKRLYPKHHARLYSLYVKKKHIWLICGFFKRPKNIVIESQGFYGYQCFLPSNYPKNNLRYTKCQYSHVVDHFKL